MPPPVAIDVKPTDQVERDAARPFTVLTIFNMASSFARKNPCAAISAFRSAFGDDPHARLIIKLANMSAYPHGLKLIQVAIADARNITLISASLEKSALNALYSEADVLISLHRSEGFGLTLAEAMLRGLPVIATNWSGNVDFLTGDPGIRCLIVWCPRRTHRGPISIRTCAGRMLISMRLRRPCAGCARIPRSDGRSERPRQRSVSRFGAARLRSDGTPASWAMTEPLLQTGERPDHHPVRVMFSYWGRRGLTQFALELARTALVTPGIAASISISRQNECFHAFTEFGAALFPVDTFASNSGMLWPLGEFHCCGQTPSSLAR